MPLEQRPIRVVDGSWSISTYSKAGRRRASAPDLPAEDPLVAQVVATGRMDIVADGVARESLRRSTAAPDGLTLDVPTRPGEALVLIARHESGALTVHPPQPAPVMTARRSSGGHRGATRFHVQARSSGPSARRGIGGRLLRIVVLKAAKDGACLLAHDLAR